MMKMEMKAMKTDVQKKKNDQVKLGKDKPLNS